MRHTGEGSILRGMCWVPAAFIAKRDSKVMPEGLGKSNPALVLVPDKDLYPPKLTSMKATDAGSRFSKLFTFIDLYRSNFIYHIWPVVTRKTGVKTLWCYLQAVFPTLRAPACRSPHACPRTRLGQNQIEIVLLDQIAPQ
jgi:hypothetical protein